jgi:hypothetical protein
VVARHCGAEPSSMDHPLSTRDHYVVLREKWE